MVETQQRPSIEEAAPVPVLQAEDEPSWMDPIIEFIRDDKLPEDKREARKIVRYAARYTLINGILYRRSTSMPYLRCLRPSQALQVLREIHEGCCGNHSGWRVLVSKTIRAGYYWPTLRADAKSYVERCDACQRYANIHHQPPARQLMNHGRSHSGGFICWDNSR